MKSACLRIIALSTICLLGSPAAYSQQKENKKRPTPDARPLKITLPTYPSFSPDGSKIVFGWAGDIWTARAKGGAARRFTTHAGDENRPLFSPDGTQIAFNRSVGGQIHVFVSNARGGIPKQVTFNSYGSKLIGWYPDGKSVLIAGTRDFGTRSPSRFYRVSLEKRDGEKLLFDAEGVSGAISPDGKKLLFTREGFDLYRKGYVGAKSSQIWLAENLETGEPKFTKLIAREFGARDPMWKPDGKGFYFTGNHGDDRQFNVWAYDLESKKEKQITKFDDDPAIIPSISADGKKMIFRKEFDLTEIELASEKAGQPRKIKLTTNEESFRNTMVKRILTKATNMSVSKDGLEVAFSTGGDIWVMDTVLKEPKQVTNTPFEEREPVFAPDGKSIYYIRESVGNMDIWHSKRADEKKYFWQNDSFVATQLTKTKLPKNDLQFLPDEKRFSYVEGQGTLKTAAPNGSDVKTHLESWNQPDYDFSPDGKWLAYSLSDNDFNRDIWIKPLDGHRKPFNLSRHPDNDSSPRWSPDGKILAFVGRRFETETDVYFVHLTREAEEVNNREKTVKSALEKMKKERKPPAPKKEEPKKDIPKAGDPKKAEPAKKAEPKKPVPKAEPKKGTPKPKPAADPKMAAGKTEAKKEPGPKKPEPKKVEPKKPDPKPPVVVKKPTEPKKEDPKKAEPKKEDPKVAEAKKPEPDKSIKIDFDKLYERIRRISIPNSTEESLLWAHDSKRLAFSAVVKGAKGTYYVTFPDKLTPTLLTTQMGGLARWDAKNDTIFWLVSGNPMSFSRGKGVAYGVKAKQEFDRREYQKAAFHQIWRTMRDKWYDENLNNKDWVAVRKKYENVAANAIDRTAFDRVAAMLLGELNGSHVGYKSTSSVLLSRTSNSIPGVSWVDSTRHLGLKFDPHHQGPGLKIDFVIPGSTTDQTDIDLKSGDVLLKIDGKPVKNQMDLTTVLNGPSGEVKLTLKARKDAKEKKERDVTIVSTTYSMATSLLQKDRLKKNRDMVDKLSKGQLGYINVSRMQWNEFIKFEEEIFARGAGKEGLIIDVRDNGGGFTADHLLTVLTPPRHAVTIPRGGGAGYPQDRLVYATWTKPIIVLCNQNSFSNAEIFAHAIKELGRGQVVGVTTAGGVISTGMTSIMDVGTLRLPFRGWFRLSDGADMELNGAVPDHIVWPEPGDWAAGKDRQIEKAVVELLKDVASEDEADQKAPKLVPFSERAAK